MNAREPSCQFKMKCKLLSRLFFIKDLNTIIQTKTKNIISRLIKAKKKEPGHVELNDLND